MADKIIVADDHPLFREGISRIIRRIVPGNIVEVADAAALWTEVQQTPVPTILILDLIFPGFEGAKSVSALRKKYPNTAIIVISMNDEKLTAEEIMDAGANGFISKSVSPDEMVNAINQIIEGDLVICIDSQDQLNDLDIDSAIDKLAPRHMDVLVGLGQGKTNKEIARDLDISPFTVRAHVSALFRNLGVSTRTAAVAIAAQNGLI
ncbi:response regulator [Lentilitoribacter sp. EG35]|uniref:response regulator n=1 Tax=Lentilitoribacter sp. EG35 TaxID=3234192 RepID=UPI003461247F